METPDFRSAESRDSRTEACGFYGRDRADVKAQTTEYPGIGTPKDLYLALRNVWSSETCAPRMRQDWSEANRTLGQCSVTAFLVQDIFGGRVWGIPLEDGGFHCFNQVGDCVFDLTSEQFGARKLDYSLQHEQFRRDHFSKAEKKERYEILKRGLKQFCDERKENQRG